MSWVILGFATLTLIILISLYLNGYFQPLPAYHLQHFPTSDQSSFGMTVASLSDSWVTEGQITDFSICADEIYQNRWQAIRQAKSRIYFETYVMSPGDRATQFADILEQKANEGVNIYILADSHGTRSIPDTYWHQLRRAGIQIRFYNSFDWRNPVKNLRRNHRKLLIIDEKKALIGGAGISDRWDGHENDHDLAPWLDYEISLEGGVIQRLKGLFWQHWLDAGGIADLSSILWEYSDLESSQILVTANENPSYHNSSIRALFQTLTLGATHRLWLASPYFLPNDHTCQTLIDAYQKGVDVKILTMGKRCDKPYVHKAAYERYERLLKENIAIYEYQPSMMHAKLALTDETWLSFGSANFDPRSFFQNDELNLTLKDTYQSLLPKVENFFEQAFNNSKRVTLSQWTKRSLKDRLTARFWLLFYWQL